MSLEAWGDEGYNDYDDEDAPDEEDIPEPEPPADHFFRTMEPRTLSNPTPIQFGVVGSQSGINLAQLNGIPVLFQGEQVGTASNARVRGDTIEMDVRFEEAAVPHPIVHRELLADHTNLAGDYNPARQSTFDPAVLRPWREPENGQRFITVDPAPGPDQSAIQMMPMSPPVAEAIQGMNSWHDWGGRLETIEERLEITQDDKGITVRLKPRETLQAISNKAWARAQLIAVFHARGRGTNAEIQRCIDQYHSAKKTTPRWVRGRELMEEIGEEVRWLDDPYPIRDFTPLGLD